MGETVNTGGAKETQTRCCGNDQRIVLASSTFNTGGLTRQILKSPSRTTLTAIKNARIHLIQNQALYCKKKRVSFAEAHVCAVIQNQKQSDSSRKKRKKSDNIKTKKNRKPILQDSNPK